MKSVILCGLFLSASLFAHADKEPDTDYLPAPVKRTINEYKGEGEIKKIKTKRENGKTYYEVDFKEHGDNQEILIAEDGTVLTEEKDRDKDDDKKEKKEKKKKGKGKAHNEKDDSLEDSSPNNGVTPKTAPSRPQPKPKTAEGLHQTKFENLPYAVQIAMTSIKDKGTIKEVKRETHGTTTLYSAYYEKGIVSFNKQGKIVDRNTIFPNKR